MANRGHLPFRTCLVCRGKKPKSDMIRLVLDPGTDEIVPDIKQIMKGRGAYACPECLPDLRLNRRVQRAFRHGVRELRLQ